MHPSLPPSKRTVLEALQRTVSQLQRGRRGCIESIDLSSPELAALDYYDGYLYRVQHLRERLARELRSGSIGSLILSGAYGVVLAEERIHKYDLKMNAAYWLRVGLNKAVEEFIERTHPQRVYAFLAAHSPYTKIIEEVDWTHLMTTFHVYEAEVVTVNSLGLHGAQQVVPRLLGEAVVEFLNGNQPTAVDRLLTIRPL